MINKYTDNNPIKLIIGNKSDLVDKKQVSDEYKILLKKQTGIDIIEISAKNNCKIIEAMKLITEKLIEKNVKGNSKANNIGNKSEKISLQYNSQNEINNLKSEYLKLMELFIYKN